MAKKLSEKEIYTDVTNGAIASVVEHIVLNKDGVHELSQRFYKEVIDEITERFGTKRIPGITIKYNKKRLKINVYIIVTLTRNFIELSKELQKEIYDELNKKFNIKPDIINVRIEGINTQTQGEVNGTKTNI